MFRELQSIAVLMYHMGVTNGKFCFSILYVSSPPDLYLSLVVVAHNALALMTVACCFVAVAVVTLRRSAARGGRRPGAKMKLRLALIVLTDVVCWLPVIMMALVSFAGHRLPILAHLITNVVLLPVNSLINPIIYTKFDKLFRRVVRKIRRKLCSGREQT